MFSHVILGTDDLPRATAFYDALLLPLGLKQRVVVPDGGPDAACWISPDSILPRFYVMGPYNRQQASAGNGTMVAFLAPSAAAVTEAYTAALQSGGVCDGPPGPRPKYGDGYFGAYLRDPDGNKVHVVFRSDLLNQG